MLWFWYLTRPACLNINLCFLSFIFITWFPFRQLNQCLFSQVCVQNSTKLWTMPSPAKIAYKRILFSRWLHKTKVSCLNGRCCSFRKALCTVRRTGTLALSCFLHHCEVPLTLSILLHSLCFGSSVHAKRCSMWLRDKWACIDTCSKFAGLWVAYCSSPTTAGWSKCSLMASDAEAIGNVEVPVFDAYSTDINMPIWVQVTR